MFLTHLIITRFNLRYPGDHAVTDDWLTHRLPIFRDFCYASLRGQTEQDFRWLLLLDSSTPAWFRQEIGRLTQWQNLLPYYLDGFNYEEIFAAIRANITPNTTRLLTTTLDNDDALAADFTTHLQAHVRQQQQPFALLNYRDGYRLDHNNDKLYEVSVPTNPFISLVETVENEQFLSIMGCLPHSTISQRFTVIEELEAAPMWLQVVHGHNLAGTGTIGRKRIPSTQLDRFTLDYQPATAESAVGMRVDQVRGSAERAVINALPAKLVRRLRKRGE